MGSHGQRVCLCPARPQRLPASAGSTGESPSGSPSLQTLHIIRRLRFFFFFLNVRSEGWNLSPQISKIDTI